MASKSCAYELSRREQDSLTHARTPCTFPLMWRWLCIVLAACSAPPEAGAPCAEGEPPYLPMPPDLGCGYFGTWPCVLTCTTAPGCEGESSFAWQQGSGPRLEWCGCDGRAHFSDPDFGGPPNTRWRWIGGCQDPCVDVLLSSRESRWVWGAVEAGPVAPECGECRDAMLVEGECVDEPSGLHRPRECCDCTRAMRASDGACVDEQLGIAVAEMCCAVP